MLGQLQLLQNKKQRSYPLVHMLAVLIRVTTLLTQHLA